MRQECRFFLGLLLLAGCAPAIRQTTLPPPPWMDKSVYTDELFVYSVGHSDYLSSESKARDQAIAQATSAFIKYCGVSVESFDRSIETYSRDRNVDRSQSDYSSKVDLRSRAFVRYAVPQSWYMTRQGKTAAASVLLRIPKQEVERIQKDRDVKLAMDVLFYFEDADGRVKPLSEGTVLKSGEGFSVYAKPSDETFVYLYELDALGRSFQLFPNSSYRTETNPVPAGRVVWIPNERDLMVLDDTTGKERFYLFASRDRIPELEADKPAITGKDLDDLVAIKKMGVVGIREKHDVVTITAPQRTRDVLEVKKKLQAEGAFVYETWFWHK